MPRVCRERKTTHAQRSAGRCDPANVEGDSAHAHRGHVPDIGKLLLPAASNAGLSARAFRSRDRDVLEGASEASAALDDVALDPVRPAIPGRLRVGAAALTDLTAK